MRFDTIFQVEARFHSDNASTLKAIYLSVPSENLALNGQAYTKIDHHFWEQSFYPFYTPEQIDHLIILLRFHRAKYNIPREFLPGYKRYTTFSDVVNFKGIVSHVNYRSGGKWDVDPAFDWKTVNEGVKAAKFESIALSARDFDAVISTEEDVEAPFYQTKDLLQLIEE